MSKVKAYYANETTYIGPISVPRSA